MTPSTDLNTFLIDLGFPSTSTGFRFDLDLSAMRSLAGEVVLRSKRVLDGIASLKLGEHTFANTLQRMNENDRIVDVWSTNVTFLANVSPSKEIRDGSSELTKLLSDFEVTQSMRVELYQSFQAFSETSEAKSLTGESARLLEFTLRDFKRNGLHLPLEQRSRIEAIKKRMSNLGVDFAKNLGEENSKYEFTKEELAGVPEDQLERFDKSPTDPTKYLLNLRYPVYFPVMEMCHVDSTRARLEKAYNQRCMVENTAILEELIRLRAEQASILGYNNFASYMLETRMAKSPEVVDTFLKGLSAKLTPLMEEELAYWKELKVADKKERGEEVPEGEVEIKAYDTRYLTRLTELKKYKLDDQLIRKYFPMEIVTAGLMEIYQRTLGLIFEEVKDRPSFAVWHEEVQLFRVLDADTRALRGFFYLDLYPREGKYGHAAVWPLRAGCALDASGARQLPVAGMVANFTKPTATAPSLLQHSEVVTYFHEMGHVLHGVCSEVTYQRFAGTSVERDFVEAPSQMLENLVNMDNVVIL